MKKFLFLFFLLSAFVLIKGKTSLYAAISDLPPYGTNVETWWSTFWANPLSSSYIPLGQIPSPAHTVTLSPGANLQNAIDTLPTSGGTILLQPGEYSGDMRIYGRNNIHVRGLGNNPSDVVLTGTIYIAGCKEASYGYRPDGYDYFVGGIFSSNNSYYVDCVNNKRATNLYFYNFTMDAKGRMDPAQNWIEVANGVVFDKIVWQGLTNDPTKVHWGHANGHVMEDNIWFRGNVFKGIYQTAVYLDGCHSCGVIESTIEANFYNTGLIYMDNNDLDYDYNNNGVFDPNELRNGRYQVTAFNNFVPSSSPSVITTYDWFNTVVLYEGEHILTLNNNVTANANDFVYLKGACSYHSNVILDFYDLILKKNILRNTGTKFFGIEYNNQYCNLGGASTYNLGKYTVTNNVMAKAGANNPFVYEVSGPITGPNIVSNNCTGLSCPDPRDSYTSPTIVPTQIPTATNIPIQTSTPTITVVPPTASPIPTIDNVSCDTGSIGDANCDGKINGEDYTIWLSHYKESATGSQFGDFTGDSKVNGLDYVRWLKNYNSTITQPPNSSYSYFPYAIFEDGNSYGGSAARSEYQADIAKLRANNITDIIYTNFTPHLDISDATGMSIVGAPQYILNPQWWNNSTVTETLSSAKQIAQPIIDGDANHPSLKGYNLADDADAYSVNKIG